MAQTGWTSNTAQIKTALKLGMLLGLQAGAQVLQNAVKRGLRGGYTSGDFVTGSSINHVTRSVPTVIGLTGTVRVGTSLMYNLFWELGHQNRYSRKYERVRVWEPALIENRMAIAKAYNIQLLSVLKRLPRIGPK